MAMGSIGKTFKRTRMNLIGAESDAVSRDFQQRFGLREGDYIRYRKERANGSYEYTARILTVESCYYNARGGYTAFVQVVPLLMTGKMGNTKGLILALNANGTGLRTLEGFAVARLPEQHDD